MRDFSNFLAFSQYPNFTSFVQKTTCAIRFIAELADDFGSNYEKYVDVLESRHYPFNSELALKTPAIF